MDNFGSMKVHDGVEDLPQMTRAVVTIGSYDGVHLGHREILRQLVDRAAARDGESVVISFDPHPRLLLYPEQTDLKLLSDRSEKVRVLRKLGIDHVVFIKFTKQFSEQSPESYVRDFLLGLFDPSAIIIGYDHKYGKDRAGDIDLMRQIASEHGVDLQVIEKHEADHIKISSSRIRQSLAGGRVSEAADLLGRPYRVAGSVAMGDQIGRTIGYPTANLVPRSSHALLPAAGIYVTDTIIMGRRYPSMSYLGDRPALEHDDSYRLETHVLDYEGDLYDQEIAIDFLYRLRADSGFESMEKLQQQLQADESASRSYHDKRVSTSAIILNYNGLAHLQTYLPAIYSAIPDTDELIIVDNASTDGSVPWLREHHPEIRLLVWEKNYGFAGGYKKALEQIQTDYYVLINSDLRFARPWYQSIIQEMESSPRIGAAQCKILSLRDPEFFEYAGAAGGYMDRWLYPLCRGRILDYCEKDLGQYDTRERIFWATGAAMVVRGCAYHEVGGLDEDFFAHQEEIDLCWRMQRAGYEIQYFPEEEVYHLGGGTLSYGSTFKTYLNFRNSLVLLIKNEQSSWLRLLLWRMVLDGVAAIKFLLSAQPAHSWAVLRAHGYIYTHIGALVRKRRQLKELLDKRDEDVVVHGRKPYSIIWNYYIKKRLSYQEMEPHEN